jgi:hypothetical protein
MRFLVQRGLKGVSATCSASASISPSAEIEDKRRFDARVVSNGEAVRQFEVVSRRTRN